MLSFFHTLLTQGPAIISTVGTWHSGLLLPHWACQPQTRKAQDESNFDDRTPRFIFVAWPSMANVPIDERWNTAYCLISRLAFIASHKIAINGLPSWRPGPASAHTRCHAPQLQRIFWDVNSSPVMYANMTWYTIFYISMVDQHSLVYHPYYLVDFQLLAQPSLNFSASQLRCQDDQTNQCRRSRVVHPGNESRTVAILGAQRLSIEVLKFVIVVG